jgi:hypothetical protein
MAMVVAMTYGGSMALFGFGGGPGYIPGHFDATGTSGNEPVAQLISKTSAQEWVGKTTAQLVAQFGQPDFTYVMDNQDRSPAGSQDVTVMTRNGPEKISEQEFTGDTTYVYNQAVEPKTKDSGTDQFSFLSVKGVIVSVQSSEY